MQPSAPAVEKLTKFLRLEAERGYDNRAVLGGLERILTPWEEEARAQGISEGVIRAVTQELRRYPDLSGEMRRRAVHHLLDRLTAAPDAEEAMEAPAAAAEEGPPGEEGWDPEAGAEADRTAAGEDAADRSLSAGLHAPLTAIPGIGPKSAATLSRLGLHTLNDLLHHFPRRYDDYSRLKTINRLWYGEEVTVLGTVEDIEVRPVRGGRMKLVEAVISDGTGSLRATWFNQPWIAERLSAGRAVALSGKIDQYLGRLVLKDPEWEPLDRQQLHTSRIVPVYPLTAGVSSKWLRRVVHAVVERYALRLADPLPDPVRASAGLLPLGKAVQQIHFPDDAEMLGRAQHRLAFDEMFFLQLGILGQKRDWTDLRGRAYAVDDSWLQKFRAGLPYPLTEDQEKAIGDLRSDLARTQPMNRLLQGEVGSGKTVVAACAVGIAAAGGAQSAVMAPTSLLAEQHFATLTELLPRAAGVSRDSIRLLIGATPEAEKEAVRAGLADGSVAVVVGTHALLEADIRFAALGLAVIDEQHRFGVAQRAALREKGAGPHLLVMTATPIPRSLALTIYGDLDLSVLEHVPPGRKPIETRLLLPAERGRAHSFVRSQVEAGRQAFLIYPLIEESEKIATKAAVEEFERLRRDVFPGLPMGLLHGRLAAEEKDAAMAAFRAGEIAVLVSTSVVEVGIDVPNATVMMVEGANRFGLSQLHQFRGRVGRGEAPSFCLLVPDTDDELENRRLKAMESTLDGFRLAEMDLEQRGPGEFLGTRQSGYAELRLARLTDLTLIEKARRAAAEIFETDPHLTRPEHGPLAERLADFWPSRKGERS
ncbi:MAG TPA: ATP-dependent DNA helicase RecG [Anaerolineales bacterium]